MASNLTMWAYLEDDEYDFPSNYLRNEYYIEFYSEIFPIKVFQKEIEQIQKIFVVQASIVNRSSGDSLLPEDDCLPDHNIVIKGWSLYTGWRIMLESLKIPHQPLSCCCGHVVTLSVFQFWWMSLIDTEIDWEAEENYDHTSVRVEFVGLRSFRFLYYTIYPSTVKCLEDALGYGRRDGIQIESLKVCQSEPSFDFVFGFYRVCKI